MGALAYRQHGRVAHWQLVELGLSTSAIGRLVARGWFYRVHRGVYAVGHTRPTTSTRWWDAVLACGPGAMLSHRSAAAVHGLRRTSSQVVHVTVPAGGSYPNQRQIVVHRVRRLEPAEHTLVDGLPVTSVARTLLDMAAIVNSDLLDELLEAAERNKTLDTTAIDAVCGRGRAGSKALKRALSVYQPMPGWTRSKLERRAFKACVSAGIAAPAVNLWIEGMECDLAWVDGKVIVEVDGPIWHGTTLARHRDPRRDTILQLARYAVMRVPEWRLVYEPQAFAADVKALLRRGPP